MKNSERKEFYNSNRGKMYEIKNYFKLRNVNIMNIVRVEQEKSLFVKYRADGKYLKT